MQLSLNRVRLLITEIWGLAWLEAAWLEASGVRLAHQTLGEGFVWGWYRGCRHISPLESEPGAPTALRQNKLSTELCSNSVVVNLLAMQNAQHLPVGHCR